MKLPSKKTIIYTVGILAACFAAYFLIGWPREYEGVQYGITWSKPYAEELGIDSQEGLGIMLEDVGVRKFRLPAYWNLIEAEQGVYDFTWLDEQLDLVQQYDGSVTLAIGARLPRWPECWAPEWVAALPQASREKAQIAYVQKVYERYSEHPVIERWQIENEVSFTFFAHCEGLTKALVKEELDFVRGREQSRAIDMQRPVITTDSGELSTWLSFAGEIDGKGVSLYRRVTNPWLGVIKYWFVPPWFYERKAKLVEPFIGPIHISEFQMEPWANVPLTSLENESMFQTLDAQQMERNLLFAERTGFSEIYFWGAEWWLWMQEGRDRPQFMDTMTDFFQSKR